MHSYQTHIGPPAGRDGPSLLGVAAFISGVTAFATYLPGLAVGALLCGHTHLRRTRPGTGRDRGLARTGLVLAYLTLGLHLLA